MVLASTALALAAAGATYAVLGGADGSGASAGGSGELADVDLTDLTYQDLSGATLSVTGSAGGRPMVVNFFASWCVPCLDEMPAFQRVADEVGDDVRFLGLAVRDRPEDTRRMVAQVGVTYDVGRDVDTAVGLETGAVVRLPGTVLVDADGRVVARHLGQLDEDELRALLRDELGIAA